MRTRTTEILPGCTDSLPHSKNIDHSIADFESARYAEHRSNLREAYVGNPTRQKGLPETCNNVSLLSFATLSGE